MQNTTKFVGLDVSKEMIAVAVADADRGAARSLGNIENTPEAIRKLMKKIGEHTDLEVCYEAGPTGYGIYLRNGLSAPQSVRNWTTKHRQWLNTLKWERHAQQITFQEYWHQIDEIQERIKRLEQEMHAQATDSPHAPVIQALQTLRGVAEVTAISLVAEVGKFSRFRSPKQLMAYAGLVPREYSSGSSRWQGGITKTGNTHVRFTVTESAWSYRHKPALKGALRKRQEGKNPQAQMIAWKAPDRLHREYFRMVSRGKESSMAVTAVARELLGFVWAIACQVEQAQDASRPAV